MIGAVLVAAQSLSLSCVVEPPRNIFVNGDAVTSNVIRIAPEVRQWAFDLTLHNGEDSVDVTLNWPGDPLTAGKAVTGIPIGPHDYAFVSLNAGPCVFTQTACMTMYTLSTQPDGGAEILIQPAALASNGDWSHPFQVFMKGRCTPKGGSK
jgi:hypothetical protein